MFSVYRYSVYLRLSKALTGSDVFRRVEGSSNPLLLQKIT